MKTEQDLQQVRLQQIEVSLELVEARLDQVVRRLDMLESELRKLRADLGYVNRKLIDVDLRLRRLESAPEAAGIEKPNPCRFLLAVGLGAAV